MSSKTRIPSRGPSAHDRESASATPPGTVASTRQQAPPVPEPAQLRSRAESLGHRFGEGGERREARNRTGMPDGLKTGLEQLSGLAMDDVRVHFNSHRPATLQAHAYTQGTNIHLGPGQERHLPHEAWHVVQQMQGRVQPTLHEHGVAINDDHGLESEADRLGARALEVGGPARATPDNATK